MEWYITVLTAVGGFAFGTLAAYINYRLSRSRIGSESLLAVMATNFARLLVDVVALTAAFLVSRKFDLPLFATLISVAVGLSVCGILFLKRLTNEIKANDAYDKDGGE